MELKPSIILDFIERLAARGTILRIKYIHAALFIVVAIAAIGWAAALSSSRLQDPDAFDYAQMGRQIRSGHGLTTLQLFPRHIPWLKARGYLGTMPPPNLYRFPLTPLAIAALQLGIPDAERASIIQTGIWFLLSIPLLYALAIEFTTAYIALLCVTAFISQSLSWGMSHDGLTESMAVLLILAVVYLTFSPRSSSRMWAFALGVACGLAYLCRTQLVFLLPWCIVFFLLAENQQRRVKLIPYVLLGAFFVLTPWFLRNTIEAGSPIFSFFNTRNLLLSTRPYPFDDIELQLMAPVALTDIFNQYGTDIVHKVAHNLWPNIINPFALTVSNSYAILLIVSALACAYLWWQKRSSDRFFWFLAGSLLLVLANFCIVSLDFIDIRFLKILNPVLIVAGVQSAVILMGELFEKRFYLMSWTIVYSLAFSACAAFFLVRVAQQFTSVRPISYDREAYEVLSAIAHGQGVVASDESYKVALYGDMRSVRLPLEPRELLEINQRYLPIRYVVLSSPLVHGGSGWRPRVYKAYVAFRRSWEFQEEYNLIKVLPNGAELYALRASE